MFARRCGLPNWSILKALGPEHPSLAASINNLGQLYHVQGKDLNNLAGLYYVQGNYAEAEPLWKRSLAIWEKALGPEHPHVATSLNNLGDLYRAQGNYAEAEPLYERSLAVWEKAFGPEHPNVATSLNNLGELYDAHGNYTEAEPLYRRSLAIREKAFIADWSDEEVFQYITEHEIALPEQYSADPPALRSLECWSCTALLNEDDRLEYTRVHHPGALSAIEGALAGGLPDDPRCDGQHHAGSLARPGRRAAGRQGCSGACR